MMSSSKYSKGGGTQCSVHGCHNSRQKLYKWDQTTCEIHKVLHEDCACARPYSLHKLPTRTGVEGEELRRQWIKALNRKDPPKNIFICSIHFKDGKPTEQNPVPNIMLGYEVTTPNTAGRKLPAKRTPVSHQVMPAKRRKLINNDFVSCNDREESPDKITDDQECVATFISTGVQVLPDTSDKATETTRRTTDGDHSYAQYPTELEDSRAPVATQTIPVPTANKWIGCTPEDLSSFAERTIKTDSDAILYTGISLAAFWSLVSVLKQFNKLTYKMSHEDQVLLTLIRLRQDFQFAIIARLFQISEGLACKIFGDWIKLMATNLCSLVVWLPKETIKMCAPSSFKKAGYSDTTCIIDCAETFMQRPSNLKTRGETYSNYKSHNTVKYLVGIAPHGHIMFISRAYGGRASDKFIVDNSGFLDYLRPNDEIMADRGFTIQDLLFPRKVKLNIPAFTKGRDQLTEREVTVTRRIASVRIHVERAIRRLKVFKILAGTLPVATLKNVDDILIVCAALVNLRPALVRDCSEEDANID